MGLEEEAQAESSYGCFSIVGEEWRKERPSAEASLEGARSWRMSVSLEEPRRDQGREVRDIAGRERVLIKSEGPDGLELHYGDIEGDERVNPKTTRRAPPPTPQVTASYRKTAKLFHWAAAP